VTHVQPPNNIEIKLSWKDVHWKAVIGLVIVGIAVCCFAFWVQAGLLGINWPFIFEKDLGVVQSILTNLGTGFMSAGLLLLLEPFIKKVVRQTAAEASQRATSTFDGRVQSLEEAFESISQHVEDTIERQHRVVREASDEFTHENVMAVMDEALDYGAIADGQVAVQATDQLGEMVVTLACHEQPLNRILSPEELGRRLRIMATTRDGRAVETWHPEESFDEVVARILAQLSRANAWALASKIDWRKAMQRVLDSIGLALAAKNREHDAVALEGRLSEVIAEGWFITDQGLECPTHQFMLSGPATFPMVRPSTYGAWGVKADLPPVEGPRPDWADEDVWSYAVDRCRQKFTKNIMITGELNDIVKVPRENIGREYP
jgi:hypothetical protein